MSSGPGGADSAGDVEWVEDLPGVPDALQRLWTPHRAVYIGGQ